MPSTVSREKTLLFALAWPDMQQEEQEIDSRGHAQCRRKYQCHLPKDDRCRVANEWAALPENLWAGVRRICDAAAMKAWHVRRVMRCRRVLPTLVI